LDDSLKKATGAAGFLRSSRPGGLFPGVKKRNLHVFLTVNSGCSQASFCGRLFSSVPARRMRGAMSHTAINSIPLALILAVRLMGQSSASSTALSDTDKAIEDFHQLSRDLNDSVKAFYKHLDQAIARHDHGYKTENGRPVQGADVDLIGGPPDVTWAAIQKFVSFRMLAARREGKPVQDPAVADVERIEQLILETRRRVEASTPVLRRLLIVSVADFDLQNDAGMKPRHDQLLKARVAAEEAAKRAMLALPIEQPEVGAPEETAEKAWDQLGRLFPRQSVSALSVPGEKGKEEERVDPPSKSRTQTAPAVPIGFERRKRVTLVNEVSYRMAVTDSGIEDDQGRHIFYQEEWVQRGQSVIRFRWRVAVETATGQHVLLKRYPPRELTGDLEELYGHRDRDYAWYLEPPDGSPEPTRDALDSALAEVARNREAVRAAAQTFKNGIAEALARQDRLNASVKEPVVDSGLPDAMRRRLYAIRAHMARVSAVLESENTVRKAISEAESSVRDLEPLAAWSNQITNPPPDWAQLLDRSDWEIDSVRNAETEALRALPPDSPRASEQFPALDKNVILRMRRLRSKNPGDGSDTSVHCLQEIWRMETRLNGTREVRRVVSLILIEPQTGNQTRVGGGTRYYRASDGDSLEEIFDENAADEVSLGS
jgi:hypothetical protein